MGCDIHAVLERQVATPDGGTKWVGVNTFVEPPHGTWGTQEERELSYRYAPTWVVTQRYYKRFAALASVRGHGPLRPLGFPADASDTARLLYEDWGADAHSASHLPLLAALEIYVKTSDLPPGLWEAESPCDFIFGVDIEEAHNYRLVFWFDN